jgi:hypothetical protein
MNVTKLRKLKKWILAEPRRYNQKYWMFSAHSDVVLNQAPPCGTAACLAGSACLMEGYKPYIDENVESRIDYVRKPRGKKQFNIENLGQEILGLTDYQSNNLFSSSCNGWSDRSRNAYFCSITLQDRAQAAVMAIDDFIASNSKSKRSKSKSKQ